ncbi:MAG: hypothetical protein K8H90_01160, partial [Thermoanaerobaculia bacterium]|nr:hypothetical protein [Thermoanaerobaculia bacterium]
ARTCSPAPTGDLVLLSAGDARHGVELFRSVVPGADLELVEDLAFDRADSAFEPAVAVGGELYLAINSRVLRSDGSPEGTLELITPQRGTCGRHDVGTTADLRPVGARMLIANGDCEVGNLWSYEPASGELSTLLGAARPDRPPFGRILAVVDGRADLLAGSDQPPAAEIWTSDGTEAETFALFSFAGEVDDLVRAGDLRVILSDQIYVWQPGDAQVRLAEENLYNWFRAFAVAGERALLEAGDLSNAATALIAVAEDGSIETLVSFEEMSWVRGRERLGDVVLFLVDRGGTGALELWVTDGTAAGTRALRGFDSPTQSSDQVRRLVPLGDRLAFLGFSPTGALELWASDGTVAGTNFPDRLGDDETTTLVAWVASTGPRVFVSGYRATAEGTSDLDVLRLWSSPDARDGATLVAEWTFPADSIFYGFDPFLELFAFDGRVYFAGASTGSGAELWASDGSVAGTGRVADIAPGPAGSWPGDFAAAGSRLYFSADDGVRGRELWSYDPSDSALCRDSSTALCLSAGRFRAEAFWTDFEGVQGDATAVPLTTDSGAFWFFDPANVELVAKVLDGTIPFGHHWVFYGALSNVR